MTYKISLEALGPLGSDGFARMVEQHIAALKEYDAHMVLVRRDAESDLPEDERHVAFPAPSAPVEIESAIRHTVRPDGTTEFTPDFEVVGPSLEQRKAKLFDKVSEAERDAISAVAPSGKLRAFQFREQDIRKADQERYKAQLAMPVTNPMPFDVFSHMNRSPDDTRFLEEQAAREDQRQQIYRWAAQHHSDIEDLAPETIDAWEMKPFNG